jgi:predicted permease
VLWAALPTSAASYVLARQLGGHGRLMAAGITAETALAALTLPAMLAMLS